MWVPGVVGALLGGYTAGLGYYASGADPSGPGFWATVGLGATIGAGAAYVPEAWGVYGAMSIGGLTAVTGDVFGQYVSQKSKAEASGKKFCFHLNGGEVATQGFIGMLGGYGGLATSQAVAWAIKPLGYNFLNPAAWGAGAGGLAPMLLNMGVPSTYGGLLLKNEPEESNECTCQ